VTLPVTLDHHNQANGRLQGTIVLDAAPAGQPDRVSKVEVTFTASLERLPNPPVKWAIFIAALVVGIGVPILVLAYLRYRAARLPAGAVQTVLVDVVVDGEKLVLTERGSVEPSNWTSSGQVDDARRAVTVGPTGSRISVEARVGYRLDQPGYAVLKVAPMVGCGSAPPNTTKDGLPTLPLELSRGWAFFTADPTAAGPLHGRLLLTAPQLAPATVMSEVVVKAQSEVPAVVARCRSGWPGARPPDQQVPAASDLSSARGPGAGPQWGPSLDPDDPFS
jgi:hypothetical protein